MHTRAGSVDFLPVPEQTAMHAYDSLVLAFLRPGPTVCFVRVLYRQFNCNLSLRLTLEIPSPFLGTLWATKHKSNP